MSLPHLLYLGDVPVESSFHGSALLYRLLQDYPPGKLLIIEGNLRNSLPERRLAGVPYRSLLIGSRRAFYSRFNSWAQFAYTLAARWRVRALERALGDFRPEAVLTVAHDFLWLTAARYARRRSVPLHFILHDDWPRMASFPELFRPWLGRQFGRVYRQAGSRLCVSPYMEEAYRTRYGRSGVVLYPSRARDCIKYERPPERLRRPPERLTVVFAGNLSKGYPGALQSVAEALLPWKGRLAIYSLETQEQGRAKGLVATNIECRGLLKSDLLVSRLREEADVLFVPMSFDEADRANMEISFPSKLTDYTIPGIPLLIYGPDYCSAVRWARENPGAAEVVSEENVGMLSAALGRLREPAHGWPMAEAALQKGDEFFSPSRAEQVFIGALKAGV